MDRANEIGIIMRNLLIIVTILLCTHLQGNRTVQLADKAQVDAAVETNNVQSFINGIYRMNQDGFGTAMIDSILNGYPSTPTALLNTTGMINAETLPVIGKYMLLVSPSRYSAPLSPTN